MVDLEQPTPSLLDIAMTQLKDLPVSPRAQTNIGLLLASHKYQTLADSIMENRKAGESVAGITDFNRNRIASELKQGYNPAYMGKESHLTFKRNTWNFCRFQLQDSFLYHALTGEEARLKHDASLLNLFSTLELASFAGPENTAVTKDMKEHLEQFAKRAADAKDLATVMQIANDFSSDGIAGKFHDAARKLFDDRTYEIGKSEGRCIDDIIASYGVLQNPSAVIQATRKIYPQLSPSPVPVPTPISV